MLTVQVRLLSLNRVAEDVGGTLEKIDLVLRVGAYLVVVHLKDAKWCPRTLDHHVDTAAHAEVEEGFVGAEARLVGEVRDDNRLADAQCI
jgi:hypothetical protein